MQGRSLYNPRRFLFYPPILHPPPATYALVMSLGPTPPLSPTTSIESTDSLVTPNPSTFVDCAVHEGVPDDHFFLFKNSSEVWEEFRDASCDPFGIPFIDAGIPTSPSSSSLLSGIDLLADTSLAAQVESDQVAVPRRASWFDFPSPPIFVPDRRIMPTGESRSIGGNPPAVSYPSRSASHEHLAQPTRHPLISPLQRWGTLPSVALHPDKRKPNGLTTNKTTSTFLTRVAEGAVAPVLQAPNLPFAAASSLTPGPIPSPVRRPRRRKTSNTFTSFIDMSANEPALSTSRVHKLFSKISGGFKFHNKHY